MNAHRIFVSLELSPQDVCPTIKFYVALIFCTVYVEYISRSQWSSGKMPNCGATDPMIECHWG